MLGRAGPSERAQPRRLLELRLAKASDRENGIGSGRRRDRERQDPDERRHEAAHQNLPGGSAV